jgi:hypothetical protein
MKKLGIPALLAILVAALVAGSAFAATGAKAKKIAFVGTYAGTATTKATDSVADIVANGAGKATLIGAGKIVGHGTGDSSAQPCVPFTGPGTMTGKAGKLLFTVLAGSSGCGDEGGHVFSISGKAKVTKGTGKLKKAKGTLKFTGVYDRDAGTFTVKFKGTLTA